MSFRRDGDSGRGRDDERMNPFGSSQGDRGGSGGGGRDRPYDDHGRDRYDDPRPQSRPLESNGGRGPPPPRMGDRGGHGGTSRRESSPYRRENGYTDDRRRDKTPPRDDRNGMRTAPSREGEFGRGPPPVRTDNRDKDERGPPPMKDGDFRSSRGSGRGGYDGGGRGGYDGGGRGGYDDKKEDRTRRDDRNDRREEDYARRDDRQDRGSAFAASSRNFAEKSDREGGYRGGGRDEERRGRDDDRRDDGYNRPPRMDDRRNDDGGNYGRPPQNDDRDTSGRSQNEDGGTARFERGARTFDGGRVQNERNRFNGDDDGDRRGRGAGGGRGGGFGGPREFGSKADDNSGFGGGGGSFGERSNSYGSERGRGGGFAGRGGRNDDRGFDGGRGAFGGGGGGFGGNRGEYSSGRGGGRGGRGFNSDDRGFDGNKGGSFTFSRGGGGGGFSSFSSGGGFSGNGGGADNRIFSFSRGGGEYTRNLDEENEYGERKFAPAGYTTEVVDVDELIARDAKMSENAHLEEDQEVKVTGEGAESIHPVESWQESGLDQGIIDLLVERCKYKKVRPIQGTAIPAVLAGRDLLAQSETGSGKSAAFLLPIIQKLMEGTRPSGCGKVRCLVLCPTRELASQLYDQARKFCVGASTEIKVRVTYGQYAVHKSKMEINEGCDILIGCMGRIKDFFQSGVIRFDSLQFFVVDEADRMLEAKKEVRELEVLLQHRNFPKPEDRQTLFFSATLGTEVQQLAKQLLKSEYLFISPKKDSGANKRITQNFIEVSGSGGKQDKLAAILLKEKEDNDGEVRKTLIFMNKKSDCNVTAIFLTGVGIQALAINGDQGQHIRDRNISHFRSGETKVLVGTDVCERGLDIQQLEHVINFDMPNDAERYVHRIGRTGRVHGGQATSFIDEADNASMNILAQIVEIARKAEQVVPEWMSTLAANSPSGGGGFGKGGGGFSSGGFNSGGGFSSGGFSSGGATETATGGFSSGNGGGFTSGGDGGFGGGGFSASEQKEENDGPSTGGGFGGFGGGAPSVSAEAVEKTKVEETQGGFPSGGFTAAAAPAAAVCADEDW